MLVALEGKTFPALATLEAMPPDDLDRAACTRANTDKRHGQENNRGSMAKSD